MKVGCIFPGQGSQSVGMGLDLYKDSQLAQQTYKKIDDIVGLPLSKLCFEGPADELKRTINTQPAILATSIAAWESYLEAGGPTPAFVAGHSLGEFSALYAAKVLSLEAVIKLVRKRAELMERCPAGAMTAILGMKYEHLSELCGHTTGSITHSSLNQKAVVVANFNTEEQLVISGDPQSVEMVSNEAKAQGAKVIPLAVGGAFHSPLMAEAADKFTEELNKYTFNDAQYPVVQNVTALPHTNGTVIKNTIEKQMTSSVLWYNTIKYMLDQGVTHFIEIGPGKALCGMIKRISKEAKFFNVEDSMSLKNTIETINNCLVS